MEQPDISTKASISDRSRVHLAQAFLSCRTAAGDFSSRLAWRLRIATLSLLHRPEIVFRSLSSYSGFGGVIVSPR